MSKVRPLLVGITGGIGSGKSTVCKIFSILGIPIYYADDRAKWLMTHDKLLKLQLMEVFGNDAYLPDGSLNRSYLAKRIFPDIEQTKKINSLVHPVVAADFKVWALGQKSCYVLKEAALIFETEGQKKLDLVINVSSPLKIRMARILMRDPQRTEQQVHQIIDQQMPDTQKNELADFVIKNTDNRLLIPQVLEIHEKITAQCKF